MISKIFAFIQKQNFYLFYIFISSTLILANDVGQGCFCKLKGEVDDCSCTVDSVDSFNNLKIYPRLQSLLDKDYFKFFKVNLNKGCPFWGDDSGCVLKDCHVSECREDQLPDGIKKADSFHKYAKESQKTSNCDDNKGSLGKLDHTISSENKEAFESWQKHDEAQDNFCELDDDNSESCQYVNLLLNPERYTGYGGFSAHRVWRSVYEENCFKTAPTDYTSFIQKQNTDMCLEKRVFYRMISGLHTSINTHLTAMWQFRDHFAGAITWGPNLAEFKRRFNPETTNGEGPQRLKNLYFAYLVELRALSKAAPYLKKELYYTGNDKEDKEVRQAVSDFLEIVNSFEDQFDETKLFIGDPKKAAKLKDEFKLHFRNISKIMDCVGCDKCRLWGKLQVQGMGTALKILFSGDDPGPNSTLDASKKNRFQMRRTEIVSLLNAFGRLSKSIFEINNFRKLLGH